MNADAVGRVVVNHQPRAERVAGVNTEMLVERQTQSVRRRDEVAITEQVHTVKIAFDKKSRRVGQVQAVLRTGYGYGRQQRRAAVSSVLVGPSICYLCLCRERSFGVEQV